MRATQRRKPDIMTSVAKQPFDAKMFNFSKINDSTELLFSLNFEQDTEKVPNFIFNLCMLALYLIHG